LRSKAAGCHYAADPWIPSDPSREPIEPITEKPGVFLLLRFGATVAGQVHPHACSEIRRAQRRVGGPGLQTRHGALSPV